ncbi:hypothetical protein ACFL3H_06580 [Gemmatimonadota bacterium]
MMVSFIRKNLSTLILAASLGLNVTLMVILLSQDTLQGRSWRDGSGRSIRSDDYRRPDWNTRMSSIPDSLRSFPRFEPAQTESLRTLRRAMYTEIEPISEEINTLQGLIQEELRGPEPAITRLDSMTSRIMRLQNQIQQRTLRLILREREILTPEQYQGFIRFMVPNQSGQMFDRGRGDRGTTDSREPGQGRRGPGRENEKPPPPPPFF